jgi:translation initiation factor 3 subunit I
VCLLFFCVQRPYLLQGHERPITVIKYNYDGDLLFSASKDQIPCIWRVENGERLGTFHGHKGTVWDLDCDRFSKQLLTASADATVKLWNIQTGDLLHTFTHRGPVRGVAWSEDNKKFATISDPFVEHNAKITIFNTSELDENSDEDDLESVLEIDVPKENSRRVQMTNISWTALNEHLLIAFDNGIVRLYNPSNGDIEEEIRVHEKKINRLQLNQSKSLFITSSADFTSKLYDTVNLKHLKTYTTDRPVNDAVISETKDHILLGGGQEAMSVTTTSGKVGKFETRFFELVYETEFGSVKGHFGPINACKLFIISLFIFLNIKENEYIVVAPRFSLSPFSNSRHSPQLTHILFFYFPFFTLPNLIFSTFFLI